MVDITLVIPIAGLVGLAFAGYLTWYVFRKDLGTPEMQEISDAIRQGAMAYMKRQYTTIIIISVILAVLIGIFIEPYYWVGASFMVGAGASALSGYIGMYVSVRSNIRTAAAARRSLNDALVTSFRGGAVSGMAVVSLSLIGVAGIYYIFSSVMGHGVSESLDAAIGFAFGASFAALFAQLGGGIYTKAADVAADLVGKIEAGIPEDDPRNPAVIADLVGDNVGDCAGRGADLFESTAAENIGAMVLGLTLYTFSTDFLGWSQGEALAWIFFPLVARSFGIFASMAGVLLVKIRNEDKDPMSGINFGLYVTCLLAAVFFYVSTKYMLGDNYLYFFAAGLIGIGLSIVIVYITQYYTSGSWRPVKEIAKASTTGPATNIITGLSIAMESTALPVIAIIVALLGSFALGQAAAPADVPATILLVYGFYGTAVATMGMLATCGFILATDTFGPITDNAGGIVEMSGQPEEIRRRTDRLDACGNTTKALTKGYAMASAALAAFLLFGAYFERVAAKTSGLDLADAFKVDIAQPDVFAGALLGAMLVFLFASLAIRAVGKTAGEMITEVRRQFREIPGIMARTAKPDYAACVDIATKGALKAMILPALLPVLVPVLFGVLMNKAGYDAPQAVGALLMVGTITGIMVANMFNNGGGAWDNGKKYVESGNFGGKGSPTHAAAVVGDTVGDPLKDTAGPSIHVLVKLLSTVTLVFVGLFVIS
ncbi:MAG: sodium-translocating pyrophosphatase [Thermoplasmata archaeon]|nr:sodium-translocating pyrophosphatase [Thermoplasmata archaeon]TFG70059.1 MAG: sodium-translocating pyrophosphatase [Methanomassiliicoccus sp.]